MAGENVQDWSTTAATNSAADSSIGWAEGQNPSTVNNSARSMMAATAKWRDLLNGSKTTGGSGNAQTLSSGVGFSSLPTGLCIRVKIGFTNTASTTLNVDGIGAVTIKDQSGSNLAGGELLLNSYCDFRYDGTNWVLLTPTRLPASTFSAGITATTGTFSGAVSGTSFAMAQGSMTSTGANGYTAIADGSNSGALLLGGTGVSSINYYRNTTHAIQNRAGNANFAVIDSTGLSVTGAGAFSGAVSMAGLSATTGTFSSTIGAAGGILTGDLVVYRAGAPTTGAVFLNNAGTRYLLNDGSGYVLSSQGLTIAGPLSGATTGTFSGALTVNSNAFVAGDLVVTGAGTMAALAATTGTFSGAVHINSNAFVAGDAIVSGTCTAAAYVTSSDERMKEDLRPTADPGAIIDATEVHDFRWKKTGKRSFGVMAQHAINVIPTAVHVEDDHWGVDYSQYVPILLAELKELRARVAALEAA